MGNLPEALAIVGPTAIGKTDISIRVATELDGEVISADARQIYRYMDIGTAKPTPEETNIIPHFMINIAEPGEYYSAGKFGELGREYVEDIISRGKIPIIVGGSGLYVRSLVDGLIEGNSRSDAIRKDLSIEIAENGLQAVYDRLMKIDAEYAKNISPNDELRIVRALEVYTLTGKTISDSFSDQKNSPLLDTIFIGLKMDRKKLVARIEERVDIMIENGLVAEVESLIEGGYSEALKKVPTIGYDEVIEHLEGCIDETEMISKIKIHSRRYAKHQMTWFKPDKRVHWIDIGENRDPTNEIIDIWNNRTSQI